MDVEGITKEYKDQCNKLFPSADKSTVEPTFNTMVEVLELFFTEINKSKQLKYIDDKPTGVDNAEYLSNIPEGVKSFEKWTQKGLSDLSHNILDKLNTLWASNLAFIYFAKFLDDQDFDNFVKNVKIPVKQHEEIKAAYSEFFAITELKPILLAIGASAIGLNNTSHALIKYAIQQLMFEDQDFYEVLNQAKEIEVQNKKGTKDSLKSNDIKHAKIRKIKEFAINLYLESSYPSVKNCAENIAEEVMKYAHNSEEIKKLPGKEKAFKLSTLPRTIERWISEYKKKQKQS